MQSGKKDNIKYLSDVLNAGFLQTVLTDSSVSR